jgi:hypothetical protein
MMREVNVKNTSVSAKLMQEIEGLGAKKKEIEGDEKVSKEMLLEVCKSKQYNKIILDDEQEQLLVANLVSTTKKEWNDKAIKKLLTKAQKEKVIKSETITTTLEKVSYERILIMVEDGEISVEDFASMYSDKTTEYIKVQRVNRKE